MIYVFWELIMTLLQVLLSYCKFLLLDALNEDTED